MRSHKTPLAQWNRPADAVLAAAFAQALQKKDATLLYRFWEQYDGPLRVNGDLLFVTRAAAGERISLSCEATRGAQVTMTQTFEPTFRFAELSCPAKGPVWYRYHGRAPYADPDNRWFRFGELPDTSVVFGEAQGRLTTLVVPSPSLGNPTREIFVYLPAVCFSGGESVGAIYMQDGDNLFEESPRAPFGTWDLRGTLDAAMAQGEMAPVAVVGITTRNRADEYLHADDLWGENQHGRFDEYTDWVAGALIPVMERCLPLVADREHRAMAGSSFGGTSAFLMAWRRPDVFSRVAAFSPSTGTGRDGQGPGCSVEGVIDGTVPSPGLRIYLDSGDEDHDGTRSYSADHRVFTDHLRNHLLALGWDGRPEYCSWDGTVPVNLPPETDPDTVPTLWWSARTPEAYADYRSFLGVEKNLLHLVGRGHRHNEAAWSQRARAAFTYLFPASAP